MKRLISLLTVLTLIVSLCTGFVVSAEDDMVEVPVFSENFDGETYAVPVILNGTNSVYHELVEEQDNNYLKFSSAWKRYGFSFDSVTSGVMNIKFDFSYDTVKKDGSTTRSFIRIGDGSQSDANKQSLVLLFMSNGRLQFATDSSSTRSICEISEDTWYSYEASLDVSKKSITFSIKNRETGTEIGKATYTVGTNLSLMDTYGYNGWPRVDIFEDFVISAVTPGTNIDNINITRLVSEPKFSGFTYFNAQGEELADATSEVTNINLNFSEAMDEESFTGQVAIKNAEGDNVSFEGVLSESGTAYEMAVSGLVPGKYTVSLGEGIKSSLGASLTPVSEKFEIKTTDILFEENFEGASFKTPVYTNGDSGVSYNVVEENNGNKYIDITGAWKGVAFNHKKVESDKYEVNFDFLFEGQRSSAFAGYRNGSAIGYMQTILWIEPGGAASFNADGNASVNTPIKLNGAQTVLTNGWYTYKAVIDQVNRNIDITITDEEGNVVGTASKTNVSKKTGTGVYPGWIMDGYGFCQLITMHDTNLDNIKIREIHEAPKVTSVKFYNEDSEELVNPTTAVKTIKIEFSEKIDEDTLNQANITFVNAKGAVSYTGRLEGKTYEMSLSDVTEGTYTLTVNNVASVYGDLMEEAYKDSFKLLDVATLFAEDFEGEVYAVAKKLGGSSDGTSVVVKGENNNYLSYSSGYARYGYEFTEVNAGKINVKFDFSYDTVDRKAFVRIGDASQGLASNQSMVLLFLDGGEIHFGTYSKGMRSLGTISAGTWYTYDATIDISRKSATVKVTDAEGTELGKGTYTVGTNIGMMGSDGYIGWPQVDIFKHFLIPSVNEGANLDNIKITRVYGAPKVNDNSVSVTLDDGTAETDLTAVNAAVKKINIDFLELMDEDTLTSSTVTLTNKDTGENVGYTGTLTGTVYTMEFASLVPGTNYELKVLGSVANEIGSKTLGEDYVLSFKTKAPEFEAELLNVVIADKQVTAFADLADGAAKVNIKTSNTLENAEDSVLIIAYYNVDGRMIKADMCDVKIDSGTAGNIGVDVTIAKPTDTTKVKVMLWDNTTNISAVCGHLEF